MTMDESTNLPDTGSHDEAEQAPLDDSTQAMNSSPVPSTHAKVEPKEMLRIPSPEPTLHETTAQGEASETEHESETQCNDDEPLEKVIEIVELSSADEGDADDEVVQLSSPPVLYNNVRVKVEKDENAVFPFHPSTGIQFDAFDTTDNPFKAPTDSLPDGSMDSELKCADKHQQLYEDENLVGEMLRQYLENQEIHGETNEGTQEATGPLLPSCTGSKNEATGYVESSLFFPDSSNGPQDMGSNVYQPQQPGNMVMLSDEEDLTKSHGQSTGLKAKVKSNRMDSGIRKRNYKRRPRKANVFAAQQTDLSGLFHNDIVGQAQENQSMEKQPALSGSKRDTALRNLLASLPEDERDLYRGDKLQLNEAAKIFTGRGRKHTAMRSAGEEGWRLMGMKSCLQHHQVIGAHFMRRREIDGNPNGGILGDVMGFGKTIVCLANLVDGMPLQNYQGPRATLIVVPSALMSQWRQEINKHIEAHTFREVIIHGPGNRWIDTTADPVAELGRRDVVITSYHEIMTSMPVNKPPESLTTERAKLEWWEKHFEENKGNLHRVHWYRIVLDESQVIKNHLSRTSLAARALQGKFRWVLSGTPVLNNLKEWYATLDFLRMAHIGSYELFCKNFCRPGSAKALSRLQITIDKVMLRRTHQSRMFGRPIVKLPSVSDKTVEVAFNSVERSIYSIVVDRFCKKVTPLKPGEKNYRSYFVLLLRLRQLVGHPLLIQKTLKDILEAEDLEQLWALTEPSATSSGRAAIDGSKDTVKALKAALNHAAKQVASAPQDRFSDNELSSAVRKYLQDLCNKGEWAKANNRRLCHSCNNLPQNPHITSCRHIYCPDCLSKMATEELARGGSTPSCLECGSLIQEIVPFRATGFEEAARRGQSASNDNAEENMDWYNLPGPILRSAKVNACVEQIKKWFAQDATSKVIVFVQFRGLIKVLSKVMDEERWGHALYEGSMSYPDRDRAIADFSNKDDTRILIAALKAGGVGLNLTAANKVIILDCWWHVLQEQQAWARAYRIGQTREVEVVRFVVKKSIDTKILDMQARKTREINSIVTDPNRAKISMADLVELFGDLSRESRSTGSDKCQKRTKKGANNTELNDGDTGQAVENDDEEFVRPDDPYDLRFIDDDVEMSGTNEPMTSNAPITIS